MRITSILCPVDFSSFSRDALNYAKELALRFEAKLILVHVVKTPDVYRTGYAGFIPLPPFEATADPRLEEWGKQLEKENASLKLDRMHLVGIPEHSIVSFAKQSGIDLIVMGSHGHTGVARFLLGSVADFVIRHAPCDVMVIRARHTNPD